MLLNPHDWSLAQQMDRVLPELSEELSTRVTQETHRSALELSTGVHADVPAMAEELLGLRRRLDDELAPLGLRCASAATHPFTVWHETVISSGDRYEQVHGSMRELARREPTFALHVHVGMGDPETAMKLVNQMRAPATPAGPVGELALLAGPRHRPGLRSHAAVPGVPTRGHPAPVRRLRGLGPVGGPDDPLRRVRRPHLPVVGRQAPAQVRHGRGAHHGRPDHGGRDRRPDGAGAVRRAAGDARGLRPAGSLGARPGAPPRTGSSPLATGKKGAHIDPTSESRIPVPALLRLPA